MATDALDLVPPRDADEAPAIAPVFVLSITRSGSTLLQRVLGSYPEVATASEPWLLLPLLAARRRGGTVADYTHDLAVDALEDFAATLPRGEADYADELRRFALRLYAKAADDPEVRWFVDKTPPYFFVVDEILDLFGDARFILLWRNPLSVMASLIHFDGGVWDPARYRENLFDGIARLAAAQRRHGDRLCVVRYEDLVAGDEGEWRRVLAHLDMAFDPATLARFADVRLEGRLGDPFGVRRYSALSTEPLDKWRARLNNPLRKAWAERWLRWLGPERLELMGYDLEHLVALLRAVPNDNAELRGDAFRLARAAAAEPARVQARRMLGLGGPSALRHVLGAKNRRSPAVDSP
jgi:Sulfotransferase family